MAKFLYCKPAVVDVVFADGSPEEAFASVARSGSVMFTGGSVSADGAPGSDGDGVAGRVVAVAAGRRTGAGAVDAGRWRRNQGAGCRHRQLQRAGIRHWKHDTITVDQVINIPLYMHIYTTVHDWEYVWKRHRMLFARKPKERNSHASIQAAANVKSCGGMLTRPATWWPTRYYLSPFNRLKWSSVCMLLLLLLFSVYGLCVPYSTLRRSAHSVVMATERSRQKDKTYLEFLGELSNCTTLCAVG